MSAPVSARKVRQRVQQQDQFLTKEVGPAMQQLLHNERVAKAKIESLEHEAERVRTLPIVVAGTLWQRLRWLVRGH